MLTAASDIAFVLSGGTSNINPNKSIGGEPSSSPIASGVLNNLFDDITSSQAVSGSEDYRCIYVFNDGETTVWDMKLWVDSLTEGGAQIELGIESVNEIQRITVIGSTGGTLTLQYKNRQFTSNYNSNTAVWAIQTQTALRNLTVSDTSDEKMFKQVSILAQNVGSNTIIFDIRWSGKDGKRNFDRIGPVLSGSVDVGNLLEPPGASAVVTVIQQGSPINSIANEINVETIPPGGVGFFASNEISPIVIPRLDPSDGFPLWIKRVVPANTSAVSADNFTLRMTAQSLET